MNLTVVFDGECGVCTRTIRVLSERDRRKVLTFRPCQSIPEGGWQRVTPEACAAAVYAVSEDGRVAAGSDSACLILAAMWNNWWPWRIGTFPGVRQVLQCGYRIIARNRRRLPGDTPWCQQHPEQCRVETSQPVEEQL